MPAFSHLWPWIGLCVATALLVVGLLVRLFSVSITERQPEVWLAWTAMAAYLLHQFEEHGVDAEGRSYAFRQALCAAVGSSDLATCSIPVAFITAVNVPLTWLAAPIYALLARQWPAVSLSLPGVLAVNLLVHAVPAFWERNYNPGLATAIILFIPLSIWSAYVAFNDRRLGLRSVATAIVAGVLLHIVLMVSLRQFMHGTISQTAMLLIQVLNPIIPIVLLIAISRNFRSASERGHKV